MFEFYINGQKQISLPTNLIQKENILKDIYF